MTAVLADSRRFDNYFNPGVSGEARGLNILFRRLSAHLRNTARGGNKTLGLDSAFAEASVDNWDGHNSAAADVGSFERVTEFVDLIPDGYAAPDFSVDPDGEISIDWVVSRSRILSISVGADGSLNFAGVLGRRRMKGVEYFDTEIPENILAAMRRILPRR